MNYNQSHSQIEAEVRKYQSSLVGLENRQCENKAPEVVPSTAEYMKYAKDAAAEAYQCASMLLTRLGPVLREPTPAPTLTTGARGIALDTPGPRCAVAIDIDGVSHKIGDTTSILLDALSRLEV